MRPAPHRNMNELRNWLILAALMISAQCGAQDRSAQIIAVEGEVTIDGRAVTCGQKISEEEEILSVDKRGYVSLLTDNGYAFKLKKGRYKVKKVLDKRTPSFARFGYSTSVITLEVSSGEIEVLAPFQAAPVASDTVTLIWKRIKSIDQYTIILKNFKDSVVMDTATTENVIHIPFRKKYEEPGLIVQIKSGPYRSKDFLVRKLTTDSDVFQADVLCNKVLSFVEREVALLALCEIHGLYFDHIHHLYRLCTFSRATQTPVTHPYYLRLLREHNFERFMFSPQ